MGQEPTPAGGPEPSGTPQPAPNEGDGKQEPKVFDEQYVKDLRSEAARHRTEAAKQKTRADELEAATLSDQEKLTAERDRLKSEVDPLKGENLRLRVALAKSLPAELVDRLRGGTQEEVEQDADKLLELVKRPDDDRPPAARDFDGGARPPVTPPASPEDQHQQFLAGLLSGRPPT